MLTIDIAPRGFDVYKSEWPPKQTTAVPSARELQLGEFHESCPIVLLVAPHRSGDVLFLLALFRLHSLLCFLK